MHFSNHSHRWLPALIAFGLVLGACADNPTEPPTAEPAFTHAGNHPAGGGGPPVSITITQQPVIAFFDATHCSIAYGLEIEGKGPTREVRWTTTMAGGVHDGLQLGQNTFLVGRTEEPWVRNLINIHDNDGHGFDALRVIVEIDGSVVAEEFTQGGTLSC